MGFADETVQTPVAIHITGASGSGTTTLGRALAARLGAVHLDTDDFYWAPVEPKFTVKRDRAERLRLLEEAIAAAGDRGWVLSGSVGAWAAPIVPCFRLVVFLTTPTDVRVARLRQREAAVFGADAVAPGGARHDMHENFIEWAAAYDVSTTAGRSRARHDAWLAELPCPYIHLDGTEPEDVLVDEVIAALRYARNERVAC